MWIAVRPLFLSTADKMQPFREGGKAEGVWGDIAFAQSCLETGNFTFSGSAVTHSQNNFCGMGVTSNGVKGNSFDTPQLGIRAQVQHLKAYASMEVLKNACIQYDIFSGFLAGLSETVELPVDFNEKLFHRLVDYATVYPDGRVVFTFRNGVEVGTEI